MTEAPRPRQVLRFSTFELSVRTGELRRAGVRIALQDHSRRLLLRLLEGPGELVTREDLRRAVWPDDTFVDWEHGLNTTVKRLRDALGDDAERPRFIETLPRRGYRFIATVEVSEAPRLPPVSEGAAAAPHRAVPAWVSLLALAGLTAVALAWASRTPGVEVTRLLASVAPADRLSSAQELERSPAVGLLRPSRTAVALSPDGRLLVFSGSGPGGQQLYLRPLARGSASPIAGTEGGESPFFSPDGEWIGFVSGGTIKKVRASGGPAVDVLLAPVPQGAALGASWGADDAIVFSLARGGLWRVPASGGAPEPLTRLADGEISHRLPHVMPNGQDVLFTVVRQTFRWAEASIEVRRSTGERRRIVERGADGRFLASGHVAYVHEGVLLAAPFDAARLKITGPAVAVLGDVMQAAYAGHGVLDTGAAQLSVSATGTLAYVSGGPFPPAERTPVWVDHRGHATPVGVPPKQYAGLRLSPDGKQLALVAVSSRPLKDIWVFRLPRGPMTRLTFEGANFFPVWTSDARRLAFGTAAGGEPNLFWAAADRSTPAERLTTTDLLQLPADWSPDGTMLLFVQRSATTQDDIMVLSRSGNGWRAAPVVSSRFREADPALSPDGRWLAYSSDESGRWEVYVRPFPGPGAPRQISNGGVEAAWARDGRTLYYLAPSTASEPPCYTMMAVAVRTGDGFSAGEPQALFETEGFVTASPVRGYDVAPDGRLLMLQAGPGPARPVTHVHIVLNWFQELRRGGAPIAGVTHGRPEAPRL